MGTDIHGVWQKKTPTGWEDVESRYEEGRHYALFALLGNVRNGYGFAGIPTHTPMVPLSDRRGLPKDFTLQDDEHNGKWMGDHSHSWLSGEELLSVNFPTIHRSGIVTRAQYDVWDGVSAPEVFSAGIWGPGIVTGTPETLSPAVTHVSITWEESTQATFAYFFDEAKRLAAEHGTIRYVFGFDS